ncbi:signal peptidase I [Proteinivorax tanatarense]|uniref:Signal peptidase I n=1 Tax=Proteinivorax tanatarense TaxID=1260629 RepID=A0AAU7VQE3_9FIRM
MKKWIEFIEIVIIVLVLTTILNSYFLDFYKVYGDSMNPLFNNGDVVLAYKRSDPSSGDIIAFYDGNDIINIKKVIAGPNDLVSSDGEKLYVNTKKAGYNQQGEFSFELADDEFFVLGKNNSVSIDSRHTGPIKKDKIIGKIIFKMWPLL